jgi:hypothetical protein
MALSLHEKDRPLAARQARKSYLERETGIEPATLCLEGLGSLIRI